MERFKEKHTSYALNFSAAETHTCYKIQCSDCGGILRVDFYSCEFIFKMGFEEFQDG
jgi:hypothetical protein